VTDWLDSSNFAATELSADLTDVATALTPVAITAFPAGPATFLVVLYGAAFRSPQDDPDREIVKVTYTDRAATPWTITRAQEGTTAKAWSAGDNCLLAMTSGMLYQLQDAIDLLAPLVSPSFTTPTLGVATATRLGIGAAASATDRLYVAGVARIYGSADVYSVLSAGAVAVTRTADTNPALATYLSASGVQESQPRYLVSVSGKNSWGNGTDVVDTNLYRSAANVLKTDDSLVVTGSCAAAGYAVGATAGIDATVALAKLTTGGANGSLTVTKGIITGYTAPT